MVAFLECVYLGIQTMTNSLRINTLNALSVDEATHQFMQCCTATTWVNKMVQSLPFSDENELITFANEHWKGLAEADYLEAFEGHPKIGDVNSLRAKYANTKALASGEQRSVNEASDEVLQALAQGNDAYDAKFGFIFIVCATGKSAAQMLQLLEQRLPNNKADELINAAEEQRKIFQIRITKMLESFNGQ